MKTGFGVHLAGGVLALAVFLAAAQYFLPQPVPVLLIAAAAFLLGSVVPDIDADTSRVRKSFNALLFLLVLTLAIWIGSENRQQVFNACWKVGITDAFACSILVPAGALALAFMATYILRKTMPQHRGVIHGPGAVLAYAILIFLLALAAGLQSMHAAFVGFAGGAGYFTHLLIDEIGDELKW